MVRVLSYGEADVIVTLVTPDLGKVSAIARGARRPKSKSIGSLEPMHGLRVTLEERPSADLWVLRASTIEVPRLHLIGDLARMRSAGLALRWFRDASSARSPEPHLWRDVSGLLDALNEPELAAPVDVLLAGVGLRMLRHVGYGLELARCVTCSRTCPEAQSAFIDASRGGIVCRACGGTGDLVGSEVRKRLWGAAQRFCEVAPEDTDLVLRLVDAALRTHAGITA